MSTPLLSRRRAGVALAILVVLLSSTAFSPLVSATPIEAPAPQARSGTHALTAEEMEAFKQAWGVRMDGKNYNNVMDGMGTGLAPPSLEDYEEMVGTVQVLDAAIAPGAPISVDLSADPCFPKVGNQGSQGSCGAWAMTYYAYGYLEAKDNGWTDAKAGNKDHLMSPAWTYNRVCGGQDSGSWMADSAEVIIDWGVPSLTAMPYNPADCTSWGSEAAFREAPLHRAYEVVLIPYQTSTVIETLRSVLSSGYPVTFAMASSNIRSFSGNYILSSQEYQASTPDHAQCLVGYDDTIVEGGEQGAFKVVNSWGTSSGDQGYYWLTYDALKEIGSAMHLTYIRDREDYQPSLLGVWHFDGAPKQNSVLRVGVGNPSSPTVSKVPFYERGMSASSASMPSFLVLDITEMEQYIGSGSFFLRLESGTGTISSFRLERYDAFSPGLPSQVSAQASGVPKAIPGSVTVSMTAYSSASLDQAVDRVGLGLTTGGRAGWTSVPSPVSFGQRSVQSGDVASGSSWMNATVLGPGNLFFDWKLDAMGYGDQLVLRVDGAVVRTLSGSADWTRETVSIGEGYHAISWAFVRSGLGGGCGWVDRVMWADQLVRIDNDDDLLQYASMMGWSGEGTASRPIVIGGFQADLSQSGDGLYMGNTTLHVLIADGAFSGSPDGAGLRLLNCRNVVVEDSVFRANHVGLSMDACTDVAVRGCTFEGNGQGLAAGGTSGQVSGNVFRSNLGLAVWVDAPLLSVFQNTMLWNNGSGDGYSADHVQAQDVSGASWHSGSLGNHWSDWTVDSNADGYADSPYDLGAADDAFPLAGVAMPPTSLAPTMEGGAVRVTWQPPVYTSGESILSYQLERVGEGETVVLDAPGDALTCLDQTVAEWRSYTYRIRAVIPLGEGSWSPTASIAVPDVTPPALTILSPAPGGWVSDSAVQVTWEGSDGGSGIDRYEVMIDGGGAIDKGTETTHTFTGVTTGGHTVTVRAHDVSGLVTESVISFSVDTSSPSVSILSPHYGEVIGSGTVSVSIRVTDAGSGAHSDIVRADGKLVHSGSNRDSIVLELELEDGEHTITVSSRDPAGNLAVATVTFRVDSSAPSLHILSPVDEITGSDVNVTCSLDDLGGSVWGEVRIDQGPWQNISATGWHLFAGLGDGPHLIEARAWDQLGRTSTVYRAFTVDTGPAEATLVQEVDIDEDDVIGVLFTEPVDRTNTSCLASFELITHWDGDMLVIVPAAPLAYGHEYEVTVHSTDLLGNVRDQVLVFRTADRGWVEGWLQHPDGRPVQNVTVVFDDGTEVVTDEDGHFKALVEVGLRTYTVRDGEEVIASGEVDVSLGQISSLGHQVVKGGLDLPLVGLMVAALLAVVAIALAVRRRR